MLTEEVNELEGTARFARREAKPYRIIRHRYARHCHDIGDTHDLRATLRAGKHTTVGGYACALVTADGATLCFECVRREYRQVSASVREQQEDGWRVISLSVECNTDEEARCEHCDNQIWEAKS